MTEAPCLSLSPQDQQVVRISFSTLFKEFKFTATWLQFPFVFGVAEGSAAGAQLGRRGEEWTWCSCCCWGRGWGWAGTTTTMRKLTECRS